MNLLLAAVLLMQDKAAEETFKKIEEQIQKAKTVSIKYKEEAFNKWGEKEQILYRSGTILLGESDKVSIRTSVLGKRWEDTSEGEHALVSDGKLLSACSEFRVKSSNTLLRNTIFPSQPCRSTFRGDLATTLARAGTAHCSSIAFGLPTIGGTKVQQEESVIPKAIVCSDMKFDGEEGDAKILAYTLQVFSFTQGVFVEKVRLWFDPKTYKLLKRGIVQGEHSRTETYEEFTLNADIPDEKFKLPEEKK